MSEATTSDEPKDDDIIAPAAADANADSSALGGIQEPVDDVSEEAIDGAPSAIEIDEMDEDDEIDAIDAQQAAPDPITEASDVDQLEASVAPFAAHATAAHATAAHATAAHTDAAHATAGGAHGGATEGVRGWMSSAGGRKIMPVASGALVAAGALLILMSLFSGGSTPPTEPPAGAAATGQLTQAMAVAKEYLTQDKPHSYRRFSAVEAEAADPTLVWNIEKVAVEGEVSIRVSGETGIVLATKDASDTVYCIADENAEDEVSKGKVDATKPEQCKGGW